MDKESEKRVLKKDIKRLEEKKERLSISIARERAKSHAAKFKREFKISLKSAIVAAFGFLIALVWKDLITEYVNKISESAPVQGKLISAFIVTLICVLGIVIVSGFLDEKD
ncbi:MAG: DUF5654 family protein [Candidatus Pacearchaeota archaeon]